MPVSVSRNLCDGRVPSLLARSSTRAHGQEQQSIATPESNSPLLPPHHLSHHQLLTNRLSNRPSNRPSQRGGSRPPHPHRQPRRGRRGTRANPVRPDNREHNRIPV